MGEAYNSHLKQREVKIKTKPGNLFSQFVPSEKSDNKILYLHALYTSKQLTWQPNLCMLTQNHSMYPNQTCSQLDKQKKTFKKSKKSGNKTFGDKSDDFYKVLAKAQHWAKHYRDIDEIPDSLIPEKYDFRNIDGYDFTGPLRDQGECGSCFSMSFI